MKYLVSFCCLFMAMHIAVASDFSLDASHNITASGTTLTVRFGGDVRPSDRLSVVDVTDRGVAIKNIVLVDVNRDSRVDAVQLLIPPRSKHSLDLSVVLVDSITKTAYCGLGQHWRGSFDGISPAGIRFASRTSFAGDVHCQNADAPTLRLNGDVIVADTTSLGGEVLLSAFTCQETSDSFGACTKSEAARQMGFASVPLASVSGNCSILAQTIYAHDRDRVIAGDESFIRLNGYCPSGIVGIGFDANATPGAITGHGIVAQNSVAIAVKMASKLASYAGKYWKKLPSWAQWTAIQIAVNEGYNAAREFVRGQVCRFTGAMC
jgi:hypothetical protein